MPSKRKPHGHRAGRPGARKTKSTRKPSVAQSGRTSKARSIPLSQLSARSYAARDRSIHVLAAMRRDPSLSPTRAARLEGVSYRTLKKYFGAELKKVGNRYYVTRSDRRVEYISLPDERGNPVAVRTHSSKDREALGRYLRDVGRYLGGDRDALSRWRGKKIAGVELVTDERAIMAIEPALSDFSLYRALQRGGA